LRAGAVIPYSPTNAQAHAIREIEADLQQTTPMTRLLQGDVGSGKTLVALMALLIAVEAGAQGALLAPTEILARQHFETLARQLSGLPVNVAILTGREKGRVREATLMGLADGSIHILVGTHAIFQQAVTYRNLGLAVVDEQHRFGVAQRIMLATAASAGDDGDPDPTHADAHALWRDGRESAGRNAAGASADRDAGALCGACG
jgi:ATP-dependent DNA helicase RecG